MNHDVSHCSDYKPDDCPKSCYRAQVTADLYAREDLAGLPFSFMSFQKNGDPECPLAPTYLAIGRRSQSLKFMLDGCDISFIAEAPNDITLEQLLKQTDKIKPDWCACGIRSLDKSEQSFPVEIVIGYSEIRKTDESVPCQIKEGGGEE